MSRKPARPWPVADLIAASGAPTVAAFAVCVGVDRTQIYRQIADHGGMLTERTADVWSCAAGVHPAEVWPGWVDRCVHEVATFDDEDLPMCTECMAWMPGCAPHRRTCSQACRARRSRRTRWTS